MAAESTDDSPRLAVADTLAPLQRPTFARLIGFTTGDFGCNIYWQSISLFLLYYYTDAVGLSAGTAGLIYMIASIWDGASDLAMGALADRTRTSLGRYRPYILFGPLPLAVSFALLYYKPTAGPVITVAFLLTTHIVFRSCYTIVSVPYTSLSARLTTDTTQRSTIAGLRMMFAMAAGLMVAYFTQPLVAWFGGINASLGFFETAAVLGALTLLTFPVTFLSTIEPEEREPPRAAISLAKDYWTSLRSNRAFWVVMVAIACTVGTQTAIGKSTLYYFKYHLHDVGSARYALTGCSAAGFVILPLWIVVERWIGKRRSWFAATILCLIGVTYFAVSNVASSRQMIVFLLLLQVPLLGMGMTFWSMLPDTVEYGEWRTGIRAESFTFGAAQFFLKAALGVTAGLFGQALQHVGFVPNETQSAATLAGMKSIMIAFPVLFLVVGGVVMFLYPMERRDHERIVEELAVRRGNNEMQSRRHTPAFRDHVRS